ncbi:THO complex subunit 5B [Humulus lupulus]|uniref:THO complex subunit 5B n=1 Tax=Humulus lupulus TaxID=3486 RepID=UPI002B407524|nr:THO complex subunit 5B [Humulus lupulus]XP_062076873.1 THO complex subunit 5B [Humulus lupulus]XP_062076874.1 THO complex subunit 5B [Humulus lupulus]XP_062076875.1 THO complex subunit 5B [Humulus lupulus]XP_062076876.1 THO complex subunit 5B [Humulus lupulus]
MEDGEVEEGMLVEEDVHTEAERKVEKSPYELLQESKASVEDIITKMLSIKKEGKPKPELKELVTQMFIHFVTLRQANRSILLQEDRVKAETENAKAPVDFATLQLHNLMYEKGHYIKAIKACKDFKSKYPDIEFVPEEEFFRDAPEEIQNSVLSNNPAHNLMLKRLDFELFQRKELCKLREKLEQQKKSLSETIVNRKKFLSSLPSHLKSLKKASLPVQNLLGVLHTKKQKQHHSAELLPPPLYVLYSQLLAQKEAFGEQVDLEILGSVKDAQTLAHQQTNVDTGISTNQESSRMEDDAVDEEEDGQRRRKRTRRIPAKDNLEHAGYQVHPLEVVLHVYDNDCEASDLKSVKLITIKFEYLLKLNVVCVGIEGSHEGPENNILCNLFPDDTGLELPHQSSKLLVGDSLVFDEKRTSRPYKWAQHLAGIDLLPELSPLLTRHATPSSDVAKSDAVKSGLSLYRQQNRVLTVVQRIRSRKKGQLALVEQLDSLMKFKWPALSCESVPWALHTPLCNFIGCSPVGLPPNNQASSSSVTDVNQVPQPTEVVELSGTSKEELESIREDGELPSLASVTSSDIKLPPSKGSNIEHSRQLSLISKSIISPISKPKSQSFKKHDEDANILLDFESDMDEPTYIESEEEHAVPIHCFEATRKWINYGIREFSLVLIRNIDTLKKSFKLESKINICVEYPLRPPFFSLRIYTSFEENPYEDDGSEWYNELRAIEAEVNLHMLKLLPPDHENYVLAHQVRCLAMLFDYYMDDISPSEKRKTTSVVDVGLCKPVSGQLVSRSYRGRDRRKMISWKDMECTPGYPY